MDAHTFLKSLTIVLGTAGVTTVLFQRLRQPVVLGYILAGFIVGPHVPIPLVADREIVQTLSELGVILLMFSLGLEFSLRKLAEVGVTAGLTALLQSSAMVWLGFMTGQAFGWTTRESLFAGAIIAISSTTIIAKAFDEQGIRGKLRELVVGILIVEDLIAILLMAVLTALSSGGGLSAGAVLQSGGKLAAFLVGLIAAGLFLVPRTIRVINRLKRPETTLVASIGICFGIALLAQEAGYSVALGAFIAGSLIAESGEGKEVEHLVLPVRDMFAAIFFVSVGMMFDPIILVEHGKAVAILTLVVVLGKILGVSLGAFLTGNGTRLSIQTGMSLAQIGEFSFIIAGLGISLGATGEFLYPIAVAVSAITTLTTPWLIRAAVPAAAFVDRTLPRPLQTFAMLYGSWIEELRSAPAEKKAGRGMRRLVDLLILDAAFLAAVAIGAAMGAESFAKWITAKLGSSIEFARIFVVIGALVVAAPFAIGIFRVTRRLGALLAEAALPVVEPGRVDMAGAPRRALLLSLRLGAALVIGLPLLALTQPFLPKWPAAGFVLLLLVLGIVFWRGAKNLEGHVRAGAEMIAEILAAQSRQGAPEEQALESVKKLLPGLGEPVAFRLERGSAAVGKTLAELNLRGLTGASVLAITRGEEGILVPAAGEVLRAGDILALAGSHDAVAAAKTLLKGTE